MPEDPRALEIESLVRRGHESPDVDAKGPGHWGSWNAEEKAELIRDMMAMGNSDRPGWIIIGISEGVAGEWLYVGLSDAQSASFDPSNVGKKVRQLSDPEIAFDVQRPQVDGKRYVAIRVEPFQSTPYVCKASVGNVLQEGTVYVRTEACETKRVAAAAQMRRLIERATQSDADSIVNRIATLMAKAGMLETKAPSNQGEADWSRLIDLAHEEAPGS